MTDLTKQLCVDAIDNPDGLYCEGDFPPKATRTHLENYYRAVDNPQRVLELLEAEEQRDLYKAVLEVIAERPASNNYKVAQEALNGGKG